MYIYIYISIYIYIYILKVMVILSYIVSSIWNPTLNGDLLHKVAFTSIREMMLQAMWVWYPQTLGEKKMQPTNPNAIT